MSNLKHFSLIELEDTAESPMIGTITNIPNNPQGKVSFKERFYSAVSEHFDSDFVVPEIPDLFTGSPYEDVIVVVEAVDYKIRILETWMY
jgi:hypothetical protein